MALSRRHWIGLAGAAIVALTQIVGPAPALAQSNDVVVFAAASLKNALDDINAAWTKETGKKAVISYAASPALARQIEQAAPADIFISADLDWMDYVAERKLIKAETRGNLLGNRLVLVGSKGSAPLAVKA